MRNFLGEPKQATVNNDARKLIRPTNDAPIVGMIAEFPEVCNARWWLVQGEIMDR